MMMTFITREGEGREDKNDDRKATRSEGRGLEESASRALMRAHLRLLADPTTIDPIPAPTLPLFLDHHYLESYTTLVRVRDQSDSDLCFCPHPIPNERESLAGR